MKYLPRIAASGNEIEKYAHIYILISCARAEDAICARRKNQANFKARMFSWKSEQKITIFFRLGQYKSLLGQLYPQSMASSHYEGVDRPSPFPDSDVLGRMHLGIQSLFLQLY